MPRTLINDLVNKGCGKVVFEKRFFQVTKICADTNGALILENRNRVGYPCGILNGIDEISLLELFDLDFYGLTLRRVDGYQLLMDMSGIRPCVDMMFNNGGIKSGHLKIGPGENIT